MITEEQGKGAITYLSPLTKPIKTAPYIYWLDIRGCF